MQNSRRVVVIGAGVIGLGVAWRLAEQGTAVTVVEAAHPGAGTSSTSFAWVNASSKSDYSTAYFELNARALQAHHALSSPLGDKGWLMATGDIELAPGAEAASKLERKVETLTGLGYAAELLTPEALEALEPGTRMPATGAAAFYREEGWADVGKMLRALLGFARQAGVALVEQDPAVEVLQQGGVAKGVRLASGKTIDADAVVIALGRWTPGFAARLGVDVPLVASATSGSKAVGLLAKVALTERAPQRLLHSPGVNWSPLANGRALLASDRGDEAVAHDRSPEVARKAAASLIAEAAALNPLFENATLDDPQIGIRALPKDSVAIVGWLKQIQSLYVVVTHSGVTLSPILGTLVANEVSGREEAALSTFRPDRFFTSAS